MAYLTSLVKGNPRIRIFTLFSKMNSSTCINASKNQHLLFLSPTFNNTLLCRKKNPTVLLIYKHHADTGSLERNLFSSRKEKNMRKLPRRKKFWGTKRKTKRKRCEDLKYSQYSLKAATARASVTIMETQETHNAFFL